MAKAEFVSYTDKELAAIEVLRANRGEHLSAADLGIANAVLTSLIKKAEDPRPMAEGVERVFVNKEQYEGVCPTCGNKISHKLYWID
jgi:hypothetical protein